MVSRHAAGVVVVLALAGCGSIFTGTSQTLTVETVEGGNRVQGAQCIVGNTKNSMNLVSPGTATVSKAHGDLTVRCEKDGKYVVKPVASSFNAVSMLGILIDLGIFSIPIDMIAGGAWKYPTNVQVDLAQASPGAPSNTPPTK